jgi:DNA polymerase-3 subunit beta
MKIQVSQSALKRAIGIVSRAVATKSPVSIVMNVLLRATDDSVTLQATDFKTAISYTFSCTVHAQGETTIPSKLFSDVISSLPNEILTLTTDSVTETTTVASQKSQNALNGITANDFPTIPALSDFSAIAVIDASVFRTALQRIIVATADSESRPVLAGVYFQYTTSDIESNQICITAADGFRLAQHVFPVVSFDTQQESNFIVPAYALTEFAKVLAFIDGNITILKNSRQIAFVMSHNDNGKIHAISTLIEGNYPNVASLASIEQRTTIVVEKSELLNAVKLARLFSTNNSHAIRLSFDPFGGIEIQSNGDGKGKNTTSVTADVNGESITVAANVNYLEDAINTIPTEKVKIHLATDKTPILLFPDSDVQYKHVIMPVVVRNWNE